VILSPLAAYRSPDDLYKTATRPRNFNNTSIVSRLVDANGYRVLFLGDIAKEGTDLMMEIYGDTLRSDMCQVSHHGVEDVPAAFYDKVRAAIWFYPCNIALYNLTDRNHDVRQALETWDTTKEILITGRKRYARAFGTKVDGNTVLFPYS
jgi:hypothetical protein